MAGTERGAAVALVFCTMFAAAALFAVSCGRGPEAVFDAKHHDFGKAGRKQVLKHVFRFRNSGSAPLSILRASGS